jgi:hypothetical protein
MATASSGSPVTSAPVEKYRQRLAVYVVWHPLFDRGESIATFLYDQLTRDSQQPLTRGIGIPVYFRTASADGELPKSIPLEEAHHTAVILLIDVAMANARQEQWGDYIANLWQQTSAPQSGHLLLPVAVSKSAFGYTKHIPELNFIRLYETPDTASQPTRLLIDITHELCRLLLNEPRAEYGGHAQTRRLDEPVEVFISHAKKDGETLAKEVRDYIGSNEQVRTFFDANVIPYGKSFAESIRRNIERTALLVVQTDAYSTREWCQREVLYAKRHRRPVLVLHYVQAGEKRSFPYLGNVPVLRYTEKTPPDIANILAQMLLEVLRNEHFLRHFEDLRRMYDRPPGRLPRGSVEPLAYAPELLTLLYMRQSKVTANTFVYPDPPLGEQELELLRFFDPSLRVTTPILLLAQGELQAGTDGGAVGTAGVVAAAAEAISPQRGLQGRLVGLSISSPGPEELLQRGFAEVHLEDAMSEFARYALTAGARLAYGGDLRAGGFTEKLHDLVRTYVAQIDAPTPKAMLNPPSERLENFLAWPTYQGMDQSKEATLKEIAQLDKVPPPPDLALTGRTPAEDEMPYVRARCLTAMREEMAKRVVARVLMGGPVGGHGTKFAGKYPGLAEEAYVALKAGNPVYLIGGLGGCAGAVVEAVRGQTPPALTEKFQFEYHEGYQARAEDFNRRATESGVEPIDYPALVDYFKMKGIAGLGNGLRPEENKRLFETVHVVEMIYLVLKGLLELAQQGKLGPPPAP